MNEHVFITSLLLILTTQVMAHKKQEFLSAKESESSNFGWM